MTTRPQSVLLDSGRRVVVTEEVTTSAPLGVRFWDWAVDRPVLEGLLVRARPAAGGAESSARPSSSGVYGFLTLPTTRDAERGSIDDFAAAPDDYVLGVWDTLGRYVPMCLTLRAPVAGVQPAPGTLPPVDGTSPALPGYSVFSAATRPVPAGHLAVRLELRDFDRPVVGEPGAYAPAAHALVAATIGTETWYGVSDAGGRALVVAPAPTMGVPAGGGPADLRGRRWDVVLRVHYERLAREDFPGIPDFADIADQADATASFVAAGFTASHTAEVIFGEDLLVTSPQRSDLLVKAPAQP